MKNKWILYVLFVLILTVGFLYVLFPADQIKNYMVFRLNKTHPEINIAIDRIKPAFPPGIRLYNVKVYQASNALLILEKVKIVPDLMSFFRSNIIFFFKANTCDGVIDGKGGVTHSSSFDRVDVDATFKDVQISKIYAVQGLSNRNVSGVLEGRLTYKKDKTTGEDLKATLVISDAKIDLLNPILTLDTITFNVIESSIVVKNRRINFKQCSLKGDQMDGSIAGSIVLEKPLERSALKLGGNIRPHPTLLAILEKDLPKNLIPKKFFSKNGLPVKLEGTIEKPIFSIN